MIIEQSYKFHVALCKKIKGSHEIGLSGESHKYCASFLEVRSMMRFIISTPFFSVI